MPFTLAHPALVLPLRGTGLPMTALVVGAMVPDLPHIVGLPDAKTWTHSARGLLTVDLALGLLGLLLWYRFYRAPLVDLSPPRWRVRLPARVAVDRATWAWSVPAVLVGSATHLVWDAFTHDDGWGTRHVPALQESYGPMTGYDWAQYVSSVLGMAVLWLALRRYLRSLPRRHHHDGPLVAPWSLAVVLGAAVLWGLAIAALVSPWGWEAVAFYGVVVWLLTAAGGTTAVCAWWHLKRRVTGERAGRT